MKKVVKINVILIITCLILISGCTKNKIENINYSGEESIYVINENATENIRKNGAEITVSNNQIFIVIDENNQIKKYESGTHKINSTEEDTSYYYIDSNNLSGTNVSFGTETASDFYDKDYGRLQYTFYGSYDYVITDIDTFIKEYKPHDELFYNNYIASIVIEKIIESISEGDYDSFNTLTLYSQEIIDNTINKLEDKGIEISNLKIKSLNLTEDSEKQIIQKQNESLYFKEITYTQLKDMLNNKQTFILEVVQTGCSHCISFTPKFKEVLSEYSVVAYSLNLTNMTVSQQNECLKKLKIDGTPTVIFFTNGVEQNNSNRIVGNRSKDIIISKFKENGYIK